MHDSCHVQTRLNIQEIAAPVGVAPAAPVEVVEAPVEVRYRLSRRLGSSDATTTNQEKPKEKTIFTVRLESFEASAKPKIIREVKALIPNLNLIDVRRLLFYTTLHLVYIIAG